MNIGPRVQGKNSPNKSGSHTSASTHNTRQNFKYPPMS